jgi:hypothetical protein
MMLAEGLLLALGLLEGRAQAKPAEAAAQDGPSAEADQGAEQFSEGRKLFKAGEYARALPLFQQAYQASHSPNARLYLARTLRELGKLPEAYEEMRATLEDARSRAETEARYGETRDSAAAELALLEPKVGKLVVALSGPSADVQVTINGTPLPHERLGRIVVLEPGKKTIVASTPAKGTVRKELTVAAGGTETVALSFEGAALQASPPSSAPPQGAPSGPGEPVRIAGYVTAGLGVASLVVFAVSAARAKSSFDTLNQECGGRRCTDLSYADEVDMGETMQTLSHVTIAIGLAGVVAGGLMIAFGGADGDAEQTAAIGLGPGGAVVRYGVRF